MKFAAQTLSVLAAAGLLVGAIGATPALAGAKAARDHDLIKLIDADLKRLDKAIFGPHRKR
jgi:hypothetical protein